MDSSRADIVLLRALRSRAGLTQVDLGRRVGTTQSAVARWEGGAVSPSLRTVERLAQACRQRLVLVAEVPDVDPAGGDEPLDASELARLAANLALTPAERLRRTTTAANFVLRGRRAIEAAGESSQGG